MIILGLTGSIGMGKSTTAKMFEAHHIPVHDADASVHKLYSGRAAPMIEAAFPGTVKDGIVDRTKLGEAVIGQADNMKKLEKIIHPLVADEREQFLSKSRQKGASLVVLDIPLLFETGGDKICDFVVVVTASAEIQRQRVLSRPGMNPGKLEKILASQISDEEKRSRADFIIDTGLGLQHAEKAVAEILDKLISGNIRDA